MSGVGDHRDDMELWRSNDELDELDEQVIGDLMAGLAVPPALLPLAESLAQVRSLAREAPPQPSAALSAVLDGAERVPPLLLVDPLSARRSRRAARVTVASGVAAVLALSSMGAAAAADRLPDRAQELVAQVIERLTPFAVSGSDTDPPPPGLLPGETDPPRPPQPAVDSGVDADVIQPSSPSDDADVREEETASADSDRRDGQPDVDQDADPRPDVPGDTDSDGTGEDAAEGSADEGPNGADDQSRREEPGDSDTGSEPTPDAEGPSADPADEDSSVSTA